MRAVAGFAKKIKSEKFRTEDIENDSRPGSFSNPEKILNKWVFLFSLIGKQIKIKIFT